MKVKPCILFLCTFFFVNYSILSAQTDEQAPSSAEDFISIKQFQNNFYQQFGYENENEFDAINLDYLGKPAPPVEPPDKRDPTRPYCKLTKEVYGYHPYWVGKAYYKAYHYNLLSTFAYFSYELNPKTGGYHSIHDWKTTSSIDLAQQAGCRIELCVTNFGNTNNTTFLSNPKAWNTFAYQIIKLLKYRNADGVHLDFEGVPSSQRKNLTDFIAFLHKKMKTHLKKPSISMALPAVDWQHVFNIPTLNRYVDRFIIMGYDYYYKTGAKAGPVAPLYHGYIWKAYTLNKSINDYLNKGLPHDKLIAALPYYGYEWKTSKKTIPAKATSRGTPRTYSFIKTYYDKKYSTKRDDHSAVPYYVLSSGKTVKQCWFEDVTSLGKKYDLIQNKNIAGVGMWALGYDNGYSDLWNLLRKKFTNCSNNCRGIAYDTGGPSGGYLRNENYTLTFTAPKYTKLSLDFNEFNVVDNLDFLHIYDGTTIYAPHIGYYTGNQIPETIYANGNSLTLHFISSEKSRGAKGWEIEWSCKQDENCDPFTKIKKIKPQYSKDFIVSFEDVDNCNSGWDEKYYQIISYDGKAWRGNPRESFFHDDFSTNELHCDWTSTTGKWTVKDGTLQQLDRQQSNSNIYTPIAQEASRSYLYHWFGKIGSSTGNRRAGLHFFSNDPRKKNRGDSYLVYFRADDNKVEIYKVENNGWNKQKARVSYKINPDQLYDHKVTFKPSTGEIKVYLDNKLVASWTDPNPYQSGSYISLRTGDCTAQYNFIKVYKSRRINEFVHLQNLACYKKKIAGARSKRNTGKPSCRVFSIAQTKQGTWTNVDMEETSVY